MAHDEDVEVYLNGVLARREADFATGDAAALKVAKNVCAVRCHQTEYGQFVDVGLLKSVAKQGNAFASPRISESPTGKITDATWFRRRHNIFHAIQT